MEYRDFEIEIRQGAGSEYLVSVLQSLDGQPRSKFRLPFSGELLKLHLSELENALLLAAATRTRKITSPEEAPVQGFGEALFNALFTGDVLAAYRASETRAREEHVALRIKLRLEHPQVALLPWEFLYDPVEAQYISLCQPLVRYVGDAQPTGALTVEPPLRILGMVASPSGYPQLDVATEKQRLQLALREVAAKGLVELTWVDGQTWECLRNALLQSTWHVLHFIGHGRYEAHHDEGQLALSDDGGNPHLLSATQVGYLLRGFENLRLVVLNACEGARGGDRDLVSSVAARLVLGRGVPAVVGMQYAISDDAAIQFGARFYSAVAQGMHVDAAVTEARIAMSLVTGGSAEWGTPVLYMQSPDGRIFDVMPTAARMHREQHELEPDEATQVRLRGLWRQAQEAFDAEQWENAIDLLGQILEEQPTYSGAAAKLGESRRQLKLAQAYRAGMEAYQQAAWVEAIRQFKNALVIDPSYRDARALVQKADRQQLLGDLFADAQHYYQTGAWQACLEVVARIRAVDPGYPDADGLEARARERLAAEAREAEQREAIARALKAIETRQWNQAVDALERLQASHLQTDETERLLAQARQELAREREAETAGAQIQRVDTLADSAERAGRASDWEEVAANLEEIQSLQPAYPNLAARLADARKKHELASLYAEAQAASTSRNWVRVRSLLERLHGIEPEYPDPAGLYAKAAAGISAVQQQAEQGTSAESASADRRVAPAVSGPEQKSATALLERLPAAPTESAALSSVAPEVVGNGPVEMLASKPAEPPSQTGPNLSRMFMAALVAAVLIAIAAVAILTHSVTDGTIVIPAAQAQRHGDAKNWQPTVGGAQATGGYADQPFWFTTGSAALDWSSRKADIEWPLKVSPGTYDVQVWIPRHASLNGINRQDATRAQYAVRDQMGNWRPALSIDQEQVSNQWISIGRFPLGTNSAVRLGDNVGNSEQWVIFDAVRAVPAK